MYSTFLCLRKTAMSAPADKCVLWLFVFLAYLPGSYLTAQPVISNDEEPIYEIAARIRNGDWAFESSLNIAVPNGQQGTGQWQMNPKGSPVWNSYGNSYGDIHTFKLAYTKATGTILWQIDFNRDGDFTDVQETKSMPVGAFAGKGFMYINIYGQGDSTGLTATLTDLTINDVPFGNYSSSSETPFSILIEDLSGIFSDIVVTGHFSLSGNGGFERPRIWVRLGQANLPPVCQLTYPIDGSNYSDSDTLVIRAIATDADGPIRKIEFYADSMKIGEDYTSPYRCTWQHITTGPHILKAKAFDNKGAFDFSDSITVYFGNNFAPVCSISSPLDSAVLYDPDTLVIEVWATDPDDGISTVTFYRDSVIIGVDSVAPYRNTTLLNPPMGMYTLSARSTDFSGSIATTTPRYITVRCIREDIDVNGTVNTFDFLLLLAAYGRACSGCPEDFNEDGLVSTTDFLRILARYGYTCN